MFASLQGVVRIPAGMTAGSLIIENHGIGYEVIVPQVELSNLPPGDTATLYIHTHVRPEEITLYGFTSMQDLSLFKLLLSVSGVGPKSALNIFNYGHSQTIIRAITNAEVAFFTQVSGLGKKTAQRIIIDLGSKLKSIKMKELDLKADQDVDQIALAALRNLGYHKRDIVKAMLAIDRQITDSSQIVKLTLKELS